MMKKLILLPILLFLFFSCQRVETVENSNNQVDHVSNSDTLNTENSADSSEVTESNSESIVIFHINDIHSNLTYLPKIKAYIDAEKKKYDNSYIMSAGDIFSGSPFVDKYEPRGFPMIHMMNEIGFDIAVLGNHEFDYGQKILNQRFEQANFPFVCANLQVKDGELKQPEPYKVFTTKAGFQIFTLGLVETSTKISDSRYVPATHPDKVKGIDFPYYRYVIKEYMDRKNESNMFVVLSHLGLTTDNFLAEDNPKIDLIIGGHSHSRTSNDNFVGNTLITQAGSKGYYVGQVTIQIKDGKILSKSSKTVPAYELTERDSDLQEKVNNYFDNEVLKEVLASNVPLYSKTETGVLICDAVNWKVNSQVSFQNSGGIRAYFKNSTISVLDVYTVDPFENEIWKYDMTYDQIKYLMTQASNYGDLKMSGFNSFKNSDGSLRIETYDGQELQSDKTYKVALNSYVGSAYNFVYTLKPEHTGLTSAECVIEYLRNKKSVDYSQANHQH